MKTALGRGLEALIPEKGDEVIQIDIERILPGEQQPRKTFRDDSLKELAASIKEKGVLQPVIVSRVGDGSFRLITGERRWRASALAGLKPFAGAVGMPVGFKDFFQPLLNGGGILQFSVHDSTLPLRAL